LLISLISLGFIVLISIIPLRLAITLYQVPTPQAILILGGDNYLRLRLASRFAKSYPTLDIWISDRRQLFRYNQRLMQEVGIPESRLHYDLCATDTVTNFTCTIDRFVEKDIKHLFLLTSDYHMARARAIATLIFGSRGIAVTPVSLPFPARLIQPESKLRIVRDCIRSLIWIVTGRTGASFNPNRF
jgi:uncharacterized SAM-binding protein YcdF (DUF218 family)